MCHAPVRQLSAISSKQVRQIFSHCQTHRSTSGQFPPWVRCWLPPLPTDVHACLEGRTLIIFITLLIMSLNLLFPVVAAAVRGTLEGHMVEGTDKGFAPLFVTQLAAP